MHLISNEELEQPSFRKSVRRGSDVGKSDAALIKQRPSALGKKV